MTSADIELVEIETEPGVMLRGHRWRGTATWIVLLHDIGEDEDLDGWRSLLPSLLNRDWSVLAVDLRGHGASDGEWEAGRAPHDLTSIAEYARAEGAAGIVLIAAGGSALHALSSTERIQPDALVLLSPVVDETTLLSPFRGSGQSRLIICGGGDQQQRRSAERLRNASIGWAAILNLPTTDLGAVLLDGPYGAHVREHIAGFIAEQDFIARSRPIGRRDRPSG